ncbi:MAG: tetratricopeptide repeat protein [Deltaproteobacteria bacterium]|nr:tetratricopeptide repeat protein [Deltaproteobacteria bacterium]
MEAAEVCLFRASVLLEQRSFEALERTLRECPPGDDWSAQNQAVWARLQTQADLSSGRGDRALERIDQALQANPRDLDLHRDRARVLLILGRLGEARIETRFVLRRHPDDPGAQAILRQIERTEAGNRTE